MSRNINVSMLCETCNDFSRRVKHTFLKFSCVCLLICSIQSKIKIHSSLSSTGRFRTSNKQKHMIWFQICLSNTGEYWLSRRVVTIRPKTRLVRWSVGNYVKKSSKHIQSHLRSRSQVVDLPEDLLGDGRSKSVHNKPFITSTSGTASWRHSSLWSASSHSPSPFDFALRRKLVTRVELIISGDKQGREEEGI